MKLKLGVLSTVMLGGLALAGCGGGFGGGYVGMAYGPPPAPRAVGFVGVAPGPGYVWTDGYWDWRGSRWNWVDGRWVVPPHPHARWTPGYWSHRHGRYYRHEGHWR